MTRQAVQAKIVSVWYCACCAMNVAIQGAPRRFKHPRCGQWTSFVRTYHAAPR